MSSSSKRLQIALSRTDRLLTRLSVLLSTPSGIDTTLLTITYTLTFLHARLSSILKHQLERIALSVAEKASETLLPGETLIADIPAPTRTKRVARALDASKQLSKLISDFRVFVRLWGLLGIYSWAKSTYLAGPKDRVVKSLIWAQVISNIFYQFLENGAYLASKGVLKWSSEKQTRWWLWSSRFWAAHVVLDFGRLARVRQLRSREAKNRGNLGEETVDGEKEEKMRKQEVEAWWRETIVNAAYAPLTLHWSVEQGAVSEAWVGFLGMVAGVVGLREKWKATRAAV